MGEAPLNDGGVVDRGDQLHAPCTARTAQGVQIGTFGLEEPGAGARREEGIVRELGRPSRALDAVEPIEHYPSEHGAELEAVAGSRRRQKDARYSRVEVKQEVIARGEVVHAALVG